MHLRTGDVLLEGSGPASHIKNLNQDGEPALVIEPPVPSDKGQGKMYLWRVMLNKLRSTGNEKSGPGIVARQVNEIHIQAMTVSYHGGGIDLRDAHGCTITGNTFAEVTKAPTLEGEPSRGILSAHNTLIATPSDRTKLGDSTVKDNSEIPTGSPASQ